MAVSLRDPMLVKALEEGRLSLDAQGADEGRSLGKYMGRFGVQNPEFYAMAMQGQERAKRLAGERLHADLGMSQARKDLWKQKMDMWLEGQAFQRKQQKWADQAQRQQAIGTGIGSIGQMIGMGLSPGGFLTKGPVDPNTVNSMYDPTRDIATRFAPDVPTFDPRFASQYQRGSTFQWR